MSNSQPRFLNAGNATDLDSRISCVFHAVSIVSRRLFLDMKDADEQLSEARIRLSDQIIRTNAAWWRLPSLPALFREPSLCFANLRYNEPACQC